MDHKAELFKFLKSHRLMSLATVSDRPWISTVFFAVDDNFNLIFVSHPQSRHAKEIMNNTAVAVAVFGSDQKTSDDKAGVQIEGIASLITGREAIKKALDLWHKANPGMEEELTLEAIENQQKSAVFKIRPITAKFLHEPHGQQEIKF